MSLQLVPITFAEAKAFIAEHHRHHIPTVGWKFGVGVERGGVLVGVAVAGRPVARGIDHRTTIEVTRVATDGSDNACSMLYGSMRRAAKALGYRKIITYTLEEESGASLRAAGWATDKEVRGRSWDTPSRPRLDKHPTVNKTRWVSDLV